MSRELGVADSGSGVVSIKMLAVVLTAVITVAGGVAAYSLDDVRDRQDTQGQMQLEMARSLEITSANLALVTRMIERHQDMPAHLDAYATQTANTERSKRNEEAIRRLQSR